MNASSEGSGMGCTVKAVVSGASAAYVPSPRSVQFA